MQRVFEEDTAPGSCMHKKLPVLKQAVWLLYPGKYINRGHVRGHVLCRYRFHFHFHGHALSPIVHA